MSDRPIIFSAPMIRALLDGRKSQTRRILKPQPGVVGLGGAENILTCDGGYAVAGRGKPQPMPYAVGDRLWVREAFSYGWPVEGNHQLPECNQEHAITYRADGNHPFGGGKWKSPIHMPSWASRLTLIVTDVRVQRLQDISAADAIREGVTLVEESLEDPREAFRAIWTSIHGPEAWDANPWCVALTFETHRCNIDQMGGNNG